MKDNALVTPTHAPACPQACPPLALPAHPAGSWGVSRYVAHIGVSRWLARVMSADETSADSWLVWYQPRAGSFSLSPELAHVGVTS